MKTRVFCFFIIVLVISACSEKKSLNIDGAWKLVQQQTIKGNSAITDFPGKNDVDAIKIWSGNYFMAFGRSRVDRTVTDDYAVGTYKLDGNRYEEHVNYITYKPWEGSTVKMTMELRNDTLIQTFPVDDNGNPDKDGFWVEKYIRLDKFSGEKTGYIDQNPYGVLMPVYLEQGITATVEKYNSMINGPEKDNYNWDRLTLDHLGSEILKRGNAQDAITIYKLNASLHPEDAEAYCTLGWAYEKTGDKKTSIEYFEKALKLDPKNMYAMERLQKVDKAIAYWGLVGSATKNGWDGPDINFSEDKNNKGIWVLKNVPLTDGEIKFRFNNDWRINLGNDEKGKLVNDGDNIKVKAGNYDFTLDLTDDSNPKNTISRH